MSTRNLFFLITVTLTSNFFRCNVESPQSRLSPVPVLSEGPGVLTWSVDAAFAVHEDMRSHTGAALTMGKGAMLSLSTKQKINTKSYTEAELVGVDDAMNFVV